MGVGPGGKQERAGLGVEFGGAHRTERGETDAIIGIGHTGPEGGGGQADAAGLGDEEGVLAHRGGRIGGHGGEQTGLQTVQPLKRPQGQHAGLRQAVGTGQGVEGARGGGLQAGVTLHQGTQGVESDDLVGMAEGRNEGADVGLGKVGMGEGLGLVMLDAPDAAEVVLAVGAHRGAGLGVKRAAGVIVGDDGRVEVQDVERAVGTELQRDRTEPMVHGTQPLAVLQQKLTRERAASGDELLVVDDVEDRFRDEDRVTIGVGPGTVLLHRHRAGGGVESDLVDLQQRGAVREVGTDDGSAGIDRVEGLGGRARGLGEDGLRQDDVLDRVTVGGLAVVELHVGGHLIAEAVAALGGDLLDGRSVGTETERAGRKTDLLLGIGNREGLAAAAVAGVDPAVGGEDEVIGDEVGVAGREASVEHLFLVGLAVAVRVTEPDDVRLADHDHAVAVVAEAGDELEALVEDLLLVGHAVAVGVDEHADLVLRRTVVAAGHEHPALLPGLGVERTASVGILGGLGHPQTAAFIPLHRDGLVDEGFRGDQ